MKLSTDFIPFAKPAFDEDELEAVIRVVKSGWLTTGKYTAAFEKAVAEKTGQKHTLAVNSATSGLHLALEASGVKEGDCVITSPYTFTATAEVIRYLGAHPIFVDIEDGSYNMSADKLEELLCSRRKSAPVDTSKIKAVIPVHIAGELCSRERINSIADDFDLRIVEDGAHLQPSTEKIAESSILVYSFYATKCLTTGEGGMIVTGDNDTAERMRTMRFHGIDREAWDRYKKSGTSSWEYDVIAPGYKYNMPDLASAIGLEQLKKTESVLKRRREIADAYDEAFRDCSFLKIPPSSDNGSRHLYILRIDDENSKLNRNMVIRHLSERGIGTSVHYKPLHIMTYYKNKYGLDAEDFPESLKKYRQSLSLPIYPDLTDSDVSRIIESVLETGKKFRSL